MSHRAPWCNFKMMLTMLVLGALGPLAGARAARAESIGWREGEGAARALGLEAGAEGTQPAAVPATDPALEEATDALDANPLADAAAALGAPLETHRAAAPAEAFPVAMVLLGGGLLVSISGARKKRAIALVA